MAIDNGTTVQLHYTGRLQNGDVFDSSEGRGPLEFTVGQGMVIPGFEDGVKGLDVGDKKKITVPPEQGYGERDENLVRKLPREQLNADELAQGQVLGLETEDGRRFQATVADVDDSMVTLDFNHMLAGHTLVFDVEIVSAE